MNLHQLLEHDAIQLPARRGKEHFEQFVQRRLAEYRTIIGQLDASEVATVVQSNRLAINDLCDALTGAIAKTFAGRPAEAFGMLATSLDSLNHTFAHLLLNNLTWKDLKVMYRVRRHVGRPLSNDGLFHIPFEERHKVATQRFSIPGLPCLYLGGSLYTCWAEMGMPAFHELSASAFWLDPASTVNVLDLSRRPNRLIRKLTPEGNLQDPANLDEVSGFVCIWPLLFACSIVVGEPQSPFKPEYIIPQLVLQWVTREQRCDGVAYASTHIQVPGPLREPGFICNFVFPARVSAPSGHCAILRSMFRNTDPHNWQVLSAVELGVD